LTEPLIVGSVLYGADAKVCEWVAQRVPVLVGRAPHNTFAALGVVRRDQIAAGVVFHNYRPGIDMEVSIAADDPAWAHPAILRRLFSYPFNQLGVIRLTCIVGRKNKRCRRFSEGLGWKLEGVVRRAYDGKEDAVLYGMLPSDCRFLEKVS
jgi:RimJ/RimL family protein N-acetyltransferase